MLRYHSKGTSQARDHGKLPESPEDKYRPAIKELRRAVRELPTGWRLDLEHRLVNECEAAKKVKDRHAARRRSDLRSIERGQSLAKASTTIAQYMEEFPDQAGFIVGGALLALREAGLRICLESGVWRVPKKPNRRPHFMRNRKPVPVAGVIGRLAKQLALSAIEHNPARRGPWVHRSAIPGARFAKPLDDACHKKLVDRPTILGFHLVFWLRAFTTPTTTGARPLVCAGAPMPTTGRPHYKVAEAFINCALGDALEEAFDLADRLRKLPQLQYDSW